MTKTKTTKRDRAVKAARQMLSKGEISSGQYNRLLHSQLKASVAKENADLARRIMADPALIWVK